MKFCYPEINCTFDTNIGKVNTIVIENQKLFYKIIDDIQSQIDGFDADSVLSDNGKLLDYKRHAELLIQFIPFSINHKTLLNKIAKELEKRALTSENYERTMKMVAEVQRYLFEVAFELQGNLDFSNCNITNLIKSSNMELMDDYNSLGEKLIDYIELVREYDKEKMFFLVNLRSYMDDWETYQFLDTIIRQQYHVILIENQEYSFLDNEKRIIIDKDLCEIM